MNDESDIPEDAIPVPMPERATKRDATHLLDLRGVAMARGEWAAIQTLIKEFVIDDAFDPSTKAMLELVLMELQQKAQAFVEMHDIAMDEITSALHLDATKVARYNKMEEWIKSPECADYLKKQILNRPK